MENAKLKIFVIDDEQNLLEPIFEAMENSLLKGQYRLIKCEYVEEIPAQLLGESKTLGLQTIQSIIEKGSNIDIAFVDRLFDGEFTDDFTGPKKIISSLLQLDAKCKILLLSKLGGFARGSKADIKGIPNKIFKTAQKKDPELVLLTTFELIKEWTVDFLSKKVNRSEKERIIYALKNNLPEQLPPIKFRDETWLPQTYLIPYFFYRQTIEEPDDAAMSPDEIINILRSVHQPKLKAWNHPTSNFAEPLAAYYEKYKEWPDRSEMKVNKKVEQFIEQYLYADVNRLPIPTNDYNFTADIRTASNSFDFVKQFETILIARRIAIGLYVLGYSGQAIWHALKKEPKAWSTLSDTERSAAKPAQLLTTYCALSLSEDVPFSNSNRAFDTFENLLEEEIEWLQDYFEMTSSDMTFLNDFIAEMRSEANPYSNNPIIKTKNKVFSYVQAESIVTAILKIMDQEDLKGTFWESMKDELNDAAITAKMKSFLTKMFTS